ncbi:DUF4244 domain-containing protein [Kroppenstedtia sanguinis]|uniref:DUF4244 domain-containing protein n=1 Tax=Kroppenstedtia sanguinis TaxID=1380684 RepID=A0ABW4C5B2_9BACL
MGFFTRFKRLWLDRCGSQTIEYVVVLAAGAALAMILHSAVDSQEIKGALLQKIEQAIALDGSTAPKEKDRIEDSPGWIARGVDYVKNGWNDLTGSPNSTTHPKIQRTMNLDIQGNSGFGGPRGGGPRGADGHVNSGGGYRGDGGNGSAKSGGNAKESPSFFERFTGWLDHKWSSLTKRFKGGGGSNASGGKPPKKTDGGSGEEKSHTKNWDRARKKGEKVKDRHTETNEKLPVKSDIHSSKDLVKDGKLVRRRYFDEHGRARMDIDYTNHGNPKQHPKVPHRHDWKWKDGVLNRGKGY